MNIIINSAFLILLVFLSEGLALKCYGPRQGKLVERGCIIGNQQHCYKKVSLAYGKISMIW